MRKRRSLLARLLVLALAAPVLVVIAEPAVAITVPETMADRRPVQRGPVEPGFPIDYVGVLWETRGEAHAHHDGEASESNGAVRFRHNGSWGPWNPLVPDGVASEGRWLSGLVSGNDAEAYQVAGLPADAVNPRVAAINTTDGRPVKVGERRGDAAHALDSTKCRSRADWGADETLMTWQPEYYPVQVMTVHHTATTNNDSDPEATVRAIYRYHAVDNGWGDIGYQYLVDESGVVYEGRSSGASRSCVTADAAGTYGDGSDFGHEEGDANANGVSDKDMVTGAHTSGANSGNMGVALLGEFTTHKRLGAEPKAAAVSSLEDVLAELSVRHGLSPTKLDVLYKNPVNGSERTVAAISGHRDWSATECPGQRLYDQLDTIRQNVASKMTADRAPDVAVIEPTDGAVVSDTWTLKASASDAEGVLAVEFHVDTFTVPATANGDGTWSAAWDTTQAADGKYNLTAVATDTASQKTTSAPVSITIDNVADAAPTTVHVSGLAGRATSIKGSWEATVTITIADDKGTPVSGATVRGTWAELGTTSTCTTGAAGTCDVKSGSVPKSTSALTFTVSDVAHSTLTYDATANSQSSIRVAKP